MNRIYRLIWNHATKAFVAVAEIARARGRSATGTIGTTTATGATFIALLGAACSALAAPPAPEQLPTGGQVSSGSAAITQNGARMDVVQSSGRAVIEWNSFNVGQSAHVNFAQPGASSVVLNRVLDTQPSQIFGRITANGQVFLTNPSGVYFSPTASVDVGGLIATSGRISDADFANGIARFSADPGAGAVVNEGRLNAAAGGYVALLAPEVRNSGVVVAELGTVALAAGAAFDLRFDGERSLVGIRVSAGELAALVENGGAAHAPGGRIVLSAQSANALQGGVVRVSGELEATAMTVGEGGRILLEASHDVVLSGSASAAATGGRGGVVRADAGRQLLVRDARIDASGATGGEVVLSGREVAVDGATGIDARGEAGGGRVRIGGGFQGRDVEVANAKTTTVGGAVTIRSDATENGDGGQVVVWSDDATAFAGSISARGGAQSGNGGAVEVSGREWLHFDGRVDAGASHGTGGTLLLDPKNITISNAAQTDGLTGGVLGFGTNATGSSIINPGTITAVTNTGTAVTLQASNDLSVDANIVSNNPIGSGGDLNLVAGRSVTINAFINTDGGALNVTANAPVASGVIAGERDAGAAQLTNNGFVLATGGSVNFTLGTGAGHAGTSGSIAAGAVFADSLTISHQGPTAGGTIDLGATAVEQLAVSSNSARDITNSFGDISVQGAPGGSVASFNAAGGNITLTAASNDFDILQLSGGNVSVNDLNSTRLGTSTMTGNFALTSHGPIAGIGDIAVTGATVIDAQAGGFGVLDPDITLSGNNSFQGPIRIVSGNDVVINNLGAVTLGGGASLAHGELRITNGAGSIQVLSSVTASDAIELTSAAGINATATITSTGGPIALTAASGDISIATAIASDIALTASGNVTAGRLTAGTVGVAAGLANDVTLSNAANAIGSVTVTSGRHANIVNSIATTLGASTLNGNLSVQSAGTISAGTLTVGGSSQFTVTTANADLLLASSGNLMAGPVAMTTAGAGSYRNLSFSNGTPVATLITGFPTSGLNDVSLEFANAPAFAIPSMSITGNLTVSLPNGSAGGGITQQAGGIQITAPSCAPLPCVPAWKGASFSTSAVASITLTDPANQIPGLQAASGLNLTLASNGPLNLGNISLDGNLAITTTGDIFQSGPASVAGSAAFAIGGNDLTLDDPGNAWNIVRVSSAHNVFLTTTTDTRLGTSTVTGTFNAEVPDALVAPPTPALVKLQSNGETVLLQGQTVFRNFDEIDLETGTLRFGPVAIVGPLAPRFVHLREDHDITQAAAWNLPDTEVRLSAINGNSVLMNNPANQLGITTLAGNVVSLTENHDITQAVAGAGWQTTGVTTLNAQGNAIDLQNPLNLFGPLAIGGTASSVTLRENADLTQAAAWSLPITPISLNATGHDIVLSQAANQLGPLVITAQNATVVENHAITQSAAWTVPGLSTVNAGSQSVDLTQAGNDFGAIGVTTTGSAQVVDANTMALGASSVGGTLNLTAGGTISQIAAIIVDLLNAETSVALQLDHADNEIARLGTLTAPGGIAVNDKTGGLDLTGILRSTGGDVLIHTEGGALTMLSGGRVEVLGAGNAVLAAGAGFDFNNQNTGGIPAVLVNTGRFLIYTTNKPTTVKGNLVGNEFTGFTFATNPPGTIAGTDNRYLYAAQVFLLITATDTARSYGNANPAFTYTVSGFLAGDTIANTLTGASSLTSVADASSNVGLYPILVSTGSLANSKGYGYNFANGNLSVTPRLINLTGSRTYDGSTAVDLGALAMAGLVSGQSINLTGSAALFSPDVGAGKPINVAGIGLANGGGGGLASNYTLSGGNHQFTVVSATTGLPTEAPILPPAPVPTSVSDTDFSQLVGLDLISARLLASFGPIMLPGDLVRRDAVAAKGNTVADAPAPVAAVPLRPESTADSLVKVSPPTGQWSTVFNSDVAFSHGAAELSQAGKKLIEQKVVQPLRTGYPLGSIFITGHTDPTGTEAFNRKLSKRRADAGKDYLVQQGVPATSIRTEGRGSTQPVPGLLCTITDLACLAPERRIEIHLFPADHGRKN